MARYHSLAILPETLGDEFEIQAKTDDGEIMAICHKKISAHRTTISPRICIYRGRTKNSGKLSKNVVNYALRILKYLTTGGRILAIRKIRKNMKIPIAIFVAAFIITILASLFAGIKDFGKNKTYALKVNKEKIDAMKIERTFSQGIENYRQNPQLTFEDADIKVLLFDSMIKDTLLSQAAKDMKVKVSGSEVSEKYNQIKSQFGDKKNIP